MEQLQLEPIVSENTQSDNPLVAKVQKAFYRRIGRVAKTVGLVTLAYATISLVMAAEKVKAATYNVPADFSTIQGAINASSNGDEIIVSPGTYYENIDMKDGITLRGSGADITTIHGGDNDHVAVFNSVSGEISDFRLTQNKYYADYSGIYVSNSTVNIENNLIDYNRYGIGLSDNSHFIIKGNKISMNAGSGIESNSFADGEIYNNIINHNHNGVSCLNSFPLIVNNTIVHNRSNGINSKRLSTAYPPNEPNTPQTITNNIIVGNEIGIRTASFSEDLPPSQFLQISYNNVWDNPYADYWEQYGSYSRTSGPTSQPFIPLPGTGEIHQPPIFVVNNGDYHLKSYGWRWDMSRGVWTWDDVNSLCIDAGNPGTPLGDELLRVPDDPDNEWGENIRINMGAYGGTVEASMGPVGWALLADMNNDGFVDFVDVGIWAGYWLTGGDELPGDLTRDGLVDGFDYALLGQVFGK